MVIITLAWMSCLLICDSFPKAPMLRRFGYLKSFVHYSIFEGFVGREMEAQRKGMDFHLDFEAHALGWFCSQGKARLS